MDDTEAWAMLTEAHTGILTTLRADGVPVSLPTWFAALEGRIYVVTRGRKVARIRRDGRASFLVEDGERWAELRAVHLTGTAQVIDPDRTLAEAIRTELDRKYAAFRTRTNAMPKATQDHYAASSATVELVPDERVLTWDNRKLGLA
jgi:nitroimidazol reductase NimA-like FMN-containing flavoprotein (pyridoxamine 5'-phosphate oxidase superfamily)